MTIRLFTILAVAVAIGLATGLSPYASASPDGLEKVAERQGFLEQGRLHAVQETSPIPEGSPEPDTRVNRRQTAAAAPAD